MWYFQSCCATSRYISCMEIYLGTKDDKRFISSYLAKQRSGKPLNLPQTHSYSTLYNLLHFKETELINQLLFKEIISPAEKLLKSIDQNFVLIDPKRYFVGYNFDSDDIGGFHGQTPGGYFYIHNYAISILLNKKLLKNEDILTLELCKNYLHDSIHSSTFRTIRRMPPQAFTEYEVYREQYGINFRKPNGISFSSREATKKAPLSINLNLLMDGVTDLYAKKCLHLEPIHYNIIGSTDLEVAIINQLLGHTYNNGIYPQPTKFITEVIDPTKLFLEYWDKNETLLPLIIKSMFSGNLTDLKGYFSKCLSNKDAWEIIFKRPSF